MKISRLIVPAATAVLLTGGLAAPPSHAATEHCDSSRYPNKVEINAGPTYDTDLAAGTPVCLKAGNQYHETTVGEGGMLVQDFILNKPGNAYLGISYYAFGEGPSS